MPSVKNLYCTPTDLTARPGAHNSASAALMLDLCESASRWIDSLTDRYFYTESGTKYVDVGDDRHVLIPDTISLSALGADSEFDGTFDGQAWVEDTDYILTPNNSFPKTQIIPTAWGNYGLCKRTKYLKLTGVFGYGDGSSDPWVDLGVTGTIDASATSLTLSAAGVVVAGHTLQLDDEQLNVTAASSTTATVERGVNGTTAAAHVAIAVKAATVPKNIRLAAIQKAIDFYSELTRAGDVESERIGDYNYKRLSASLANARDMMMVNQFVRMTI